MSIFNKRSTLVASCPDFRANIRETSSGQWLAEVFFTEKGRQPLDYTFATFDSLKRHLSSLTDLRVTYAEEVQEVLQPGQRSGYKRPATRYWRNIKRPTRPRLYRQAGSCSRTRCRKPLFRLLSLIIFKRIQSGFCSMTTTSAFWSDTFRSLHKVVALLSMTAICNSTRL